MAADNFTYERAAIINWIKRRGSQGQVATSPETNVPIANNNLRPNTTLKKAIKEAIQKKMNEATGARVSLTNVRGLICSVQLEQRQAR